MKKIFTLILALFLFIGAKAQNTRTITGLVIANDDQNPIAGAYVKSLPSNKHTTTDKAGKFTIVLSSGDTQLEISFIGYKTKSLAIGKSNQVKIALNPDNKALEEVVVVGYGAAAPQKTSAVSNIQVIQPPINQALVGRVAGVSLNSNQQSVSRDKIRTQIRPSDNESYGTIKEIGFLKAEKDPLSTFSIDVDAAAYSNVRRFINNGGLPPKDAVRIEEMVNYFDYDYAQPTGKDPVNIVTEIAPAPWNPNHRLLHIGLQAKTISTESLPASNLVFLIDVSGSMNSANKLPLLVSSLKLLTDQLRAKDKVAIVVYAGSSGLALPATAGDNKTTIKEALNRLSAGGSTAGGAGLELAYKVATENFVKGGNNRIILATDGDFNVGQSSDSDMQKLIEEKRKSGVFLTVLGYGMGNYKDSKMETLADKGNGNYAYIDNITEAKKYWLMSLAVRYLPLPKM